MPHPGGRIEVRRSEYGVTLSCVIPGYAGWIVTRATLPEALTALSVNLAPREAGRGDWLARVDDSARTFAAVAGDNGGLRDILTLLEEHTDLWARSEANGSRADLRVHLRRCVDAVATKLTQHADDLANVLDPEWGADLGVEGDA